MTNFRTFIFIVFIVVPFSSVLADNNTVLTKSESCEGYVKRMEKFKDISGSQQDYYYLRCKAAHGATNKEFESVAYAKKEMGDSYKGVSETVAKLWYMSAYETASADKENNEYSFNDSAYELGLISQEKGNLSQAFEYFLESARYGHKYGQYETGLAYMRGDGVIKNYVKAYAWLNVCASDDAGRSELAKEKIQEIESSMTKAAIGKAQALSETYYSNVHGE